MHGSLARASSSAAVAREPSEHHRSGRSSGATGGAATSSAAAIVGRTRHIPLENLDEMEEHLKRHGKRAKKVHPEDPRLIARQSRPVATSSSSNGGGGPSNGDAATTSVATVSPKKRSKGHEKVS